MEIQLILNPLPTNNDSIDPDEINNFFQQQQSQLHQNVPQYRYQHQHQHIQQQQQQLQSTENNNNNQNEITKYQWEDIITPSTHEYTESSRKPRVIKKSSQPTGIVSKVQQQKVRDWSSYSCKSIGISNLVSLRRLTKEKQIDYNFTKESTSPNNKTTYNF